MNFNNQISTNKTQSQRLIELGLKTETADVSLYNGIGLEHKYEWETVMFKYSLIKDYKDFESTFSEHLFPSWSLCNLLSMCDDVIRFGKDYIVCAMDFETKTNNGFDGIIDCIEWLISKNMFNKNYLTK